MTVEVEGKVMQNLVQRFLKKYGSSGRFPEDYNLFSKNLLLIVRSMGITWEVFGNAKSQALP